MGHDLEDWYALRNSLPPPPPLSFCGLLYTMYSNIHLLVQVISLNAMFIYFYIIKLMYMYIFSYVYIITLMYVL